MKFYDTNALLLLDDKAFEERFAISDVTLRELEKIKDSKTKSEDVKYKARKLSVLLDDHYDMYDIYRGISPVRDPTPDDLIIGSAKFAAEMQPITFYSNDICCKNLARLNGLNVKGVELEETDTYTGFRELCMSDEEMSYFYTNSGENIYDLLTNQYLIIRNTQGELCDAYRWNGEKHQPLYKKAVESIYFEKLKAKDIYQSCVIDSIMNNQFTAISGKAGSGKSLLSLMAVMNLIKRGEYDRVIVMFNPTKTRGATDMGFYGGDANKKAMQNSIGNILTTKFGDRSAVDYLLNDEKLRLVSIADCRGMEIKDREILYISEAQNTSVDLIKLCLTRVSEKAKVIIEGDFDTQVDARIFEGSNNGLKRVVEVFRGEPEFGYVKLQNIYRSRIAELCEKL